MKIQIIDYAILKKNQKGLTNDTGTTKRTDVSALDISKGLLDGFAGCTDLVAVMGEEWVKGYREYLNAWKVLNA